MEENISEVKGLAKKVFGVNSVFGGISSQKIAHGQHDLISVRGSGLIPRIVAKIIPHYGKVYVLDKRYEDKALEFAEQYRLMFMPDDGFLRVVRHYR
jgi:hypothetical protein